MIHGASNEGATLSFLTMRIAIRGNVAGTLTLIF
jgi:hypothetical protein